MKINFRSSKSQWVYAARRSGKLSIWTAVFGLAFANAADMGVPSAKIDSTLLYGTWTAESGDGRRAQRGIEKFKEDSTFELAIFKDSECREVRFSAKGVWWIDGSRLFTRTSETSDAENRLHVGTVLQDEIVSLSENELILRSHGRLYYRKRGSPC
jgi:hypothetical protein